ncbi:hypothetical protein BH10PSE7_BH10PSE7_05940 [soil metagenome]
MIGLALRLRTQVGRLFNALASDLTRGLRRPPDWRLLVLVGSEGFEIFAKRNKAVTQIATIAGNLTPAETLALKRMVASLAAPRLETVIRLRPERVIIKQIDLPGTATNYADAIVRNRIERIAPWPAAEAVFGYVVDTGTPAGQIVVKVAVAGRKQLKGVADVLGGIGIDAGRVDVGEDQNTANSIELAADQSGGNQIAGRAMAASIAAMLLFLFAIGAAGGYQAYTAWHNFTVNGERIAQLQEQAIGAGDTAEERAVLAAIEDLVSRKVAERPFSSALLELTRAIPDNAWITETSYRRPDITITGKGQQVPPLIGDLESSPGFAEVNFAAPTRREGSESVDTFSIHAKVSPRSEPLP